MKARWRTDAVEWDTSVLDSLNHLQYYKDTEWTVCSPATAVSYTHLVREMELLSPDEKAETSVLYQNPYWSTKIGEVAEE